MKGYLIIADDFTASNDTGVQMRKAGIPVNIIIFPDKENISSQSLVLDTETRNLAEGEAVERVRKLAADLLKEDFSFVYKKVDSTLRGHIRAEIETILEGYPADCVIFAPAYPANNRTSINGVQYLKGQALMETEISKDPINPIGSHHLIDYLPNPSEVRQHSLADIRSDKIDFSGKYHSFDAETDEDLALIAGAALQTNLKILYVGSAGLAHAIFSILNPRKPALALVGSVSAVTLDQVTYAEEKGLSVYKLSLEALLADEDAYQHCLTEIVDILRGGKDLVLVSARSRKDLEATISCGEAKGLSGWQVFDRVRQTLGRLGRDVLSAFDLSGLVLSGGDTAISLIRALGAYGAEIHEEVLTGVVLSTLRGGPWHNLPIITKAGAFGGKETLDLCLKRLKEIQWDN